MEELFSKVGFKGYYRDEYTEFYRKYFHSEEELNNFFIQVFKNDDIDNTPRRIMNQIQRFVSLANDIEKIRPSRDALRIVFFRTCIESLCKLANKNDKKKEDVDKKLFFNKYLDYEEQQYILDNFVFTGLEPLYEMEEMEKLVFDTKETYDLSIDDFSSIFFVVRGMVVHEGDYWSMQFFSRDNEYTWLTSMETDKKMISCYTPQKGEKIEYHFETTLNYDKFAKIFVNGCIRYLKTYINNM